MMSFPLLFLLIQSFTFASPEGRAVAYLAREVPRWASENHCYSCHNNGDGARALYRARRLGFALPDQALHDTTRWLVEPEQWDARARVTRPTDKPLIHLQFATALHEATRAGLVENRRALLAAAELVAADQERDGSWQVDADAVVGAPATYGACLATAQACCLLREVNAERFRAPLVKAEAWLVRQKPGSVADAAAVFVALQPTDGKVAIDQRRRCREVLERAQGSDGGWGPYRNAASEPFDTALVLLALAGEKDSPAEEMIRRGRAYLVATQRKEGNWPETTRPAEGASYAERISTAAWATLALLATRGR